jgi:hypothetical protein
MAKDAKPGLMSVEEDAAFESLAKTDLERIPAGVWDGAIVLWRYLPHLAPATRRRLLLHMIRLCWKRNEPPSRYLVESLELELETPNRPRARVDTNRMQEAARYLVDHPRAGAREVGMQLNIPPTTVQSFFKRHEFWNECQEQRTLRGARERLSEKELRHLLQPVRTKK